MMMPDLSGPRSVRFVAAGGFPGGDGAVRPASVASGGIDDLWDQARGQDALVILTLVPLRPHHSMLVAGLAEAHSHGRAPIIDVHRPAVGAAQRPEVGHHAVLPEEPVVRAGNGTALADHLASVVDLEGVAAEPTETPEVGHLAVLPQERALVAKHG